MDFLAGLLLGVISVILIFYFTFIKDTKVTHEVIHDKPTDPKPKKLSDVVVDKLARVRAISDEQHSLLTQTQALSSNALHSKYKNKLTFKIQELEKEKINTLNSILKDGHDPVITMQDSTTGVVTEAPLSEFMQTMFHADFPPPNTPKGTKITQKGKFYVLESEEDFDRDDNDDNNGNKTIH